MIPPKVRADYMLATYDQHPDAGGGTVSVFKPGLMEKITQLMPPVQTKLAPRHFSPKQAAPCRAHVPRAHKEGPCHRRLCPHDTRRRSSSAALYYIGLPDPLAAVPQPESRSISFRGRHLHLITSRPAWPCTRRPELGWHAGQLLYTLRRAVAGIGGLWSGRHCPAAGQLTPGVHGRRQRRAAMSGSSKYSFAEHDSSSALIRLTRGAPRRCSGRLTSDCALSGDARNGRCRNPAAAGARADHPLQAVREPWPCAKRALAARAA